MAIQFKRGLNATKPTTALAGEPVFCTDGEFYIGTGTGLKQISGGVSTSANKLSTARNISHSGDVTGTGSFDGSADVAITMTLANSGATAGTYKSVTVDAKGRVTGGTNPTTLGGYGITDGAPIASPSFTGTPSTPTATAGTNTTQIASTAFVVTAIANLVASAPSALDTLNELATALGNDANFSTTMTNALASKAPLASPTFTGSVNMPTQTAGNNTTLGATTAFVATAIANAIATIDGGTF